MGTDVSGHYNLGQEYGVYIYDATGNSVDHNDIDYSSVAGIADLYASSSPDNTLSPNSFAHDKVNVQYEQVDLPL